MTPKASTERPAAARSREDSLERIRSDRMQEMTAPRAIRALSTPTKAAATVIFSLSSSQISDRILTGSPKP